MLSISCDAGIDIVIKSIEALKMNYLHGGGAKFQNFHTVKPKNGGRVVKTEVPKMNVGSCNLGRYFYPPFPHKF